MRQQRVQSRLQVRHHHRRTHALAFHVRHHRQHRVRRQLNEIVIIAARFERRPVRHRDIESLKLSAATPAAVPSECCAPAPDRVPCAACAPFRGAVAHFRAPAPRDRKSRCSIFSSARENGPVFLFSSCSTPIVSPPLLRIGRHKQRLRPIIPAANPLPIRIANRHTHPPDSPSRRAAPPNPQFPW